MKTELVLVNIGTPNSPEPEDVGSYLKEFLMDPDVITLPYVFRWILVNILIVPKRKHLSSHAYKKVWNERGSPLMTLTEDLIEELSPHLQNMSAHIAMRYGSPSISQVLSRLQASDKIIILPMFPQFADATTSSVTSECLRVARSLGIEEKLQFLPEFFSDSEFIDSLVESVETKRERFDHLLFSYHGLPQNHITRRDQTGAHCLKKSDCCDQMSSVNGKCYRAQCFATTRAVVDKLGLQKEEFTVSFQSRLGRAEWIRPYTDETVKKLAERGVKRLGIVCPAFLIDCLETLEEIAIGIREEFIASGGEELELIPCLNADPAWSRRLSSWVEKKRLS